jgi:hypothetical protein
LDDAAFIIKDANGEPLSRCLTSSLLVNEHAEKSDILFIGTVLKLSSEGQEKKKDDKIIPILDILSCSPMGFSLRNMEDDAK